MFDFPSYRDEKKLFHSAVFQYWNKFKDEGATAPRTLRASAAPWRIRYLVGTNCVVARALCRVLVPALE